MLRELLMEDRIAMRQGKKQIYGSPYQRDPETGNYSIYPIADEIHVNGRRKSVGLSPLEVDARNYGIDYNLPSKNQVYVYPSFNQRIQDKQ